MLEFLFYSSIHLLLHYFFVIVTTGSPHGNGVTFPSGTGKSYHPEVSKRIQEVI